MCSGPLQLQPRWSRPQEPQPSIQCWRCGRSDPGGPFRTAHPLYFHKSLPGPSGQSEPSRDRMARKCECTSSPASPYSRFFQPRRIPGQFIGRGVQNLNFDPVIAGAGGAFNIPADANERAEADPERYIERRALPGGRAVPLLETLTLNGLLGPVRLVPYLNVDLPLAPRTSGGQEQNAGSKATH